MDGRRDPEPRGVGTGPEPAADDAAVFHVERVGGGSARRPALVVGVVTLAVAALVVGGALGEDGPKPAVAAPTPAAHAAPTRGRDVAANRAIPVPTAVATLEASPTLDIRTRAWGPYVYVQGDVFDLDTEVVVVSIWSPDDAVLQVRTVSMPGGSTAFRLGPNDRFQLAFEVGGIAAQEVAYVQANAYNGVGLPIASARQHLSPAVDPGWWRGEGT